LSEIPRLVCPVTCPGCVQKMERAEMAGAWIDAAGRYRGAYALCSRCSAIMQGGSDAERTAITERVETALLLAGASPSREVN